MPQTFIFLFKPASCGNVTIATVAVASIYSSGFLFLLFCSIVPFSTELSLYYQQTNFALNLCL